MKSKLPLIESDFVPRLVRVFQYMTLCVCKSFNVMANFYCLHTNWYIDYIIQCGTFNDKSLPKFSFFVKS